MYCMANSCFQPENSVDTTSVSDHESPSFSLDPVLQQVYVLCEKIFALVKNVYKIVY